MAKPKTLFYCQNCGTSYSKWQGKCTSCNQWETIVEEIIARETTQSLWRDKKSKQAKAIRIDEINDENNAPRYETSSYEFNRVLGGGIVAGSVILVGGEPGVGKSTLLLQVALTMPIKTLYISGEESEHQIKMRADRVRKNKQSNCLVFTETNTQKIFSQIKSIQPQLVIVDSIQTMYSETIEASSGSISQIRQCASEWIDYSKKSNTPVMLIGHITKEGNIAGPKIMEHMVDVVLQFEGDRNHLFRTLRAYKNRFGSTAELGLYEMAQGGLREISNPSQVLISKHENLLNGTAISSIVEGIRPFMIEVQALVSVAIYGTPQRSSTGFNVKRLHMLLAVLEKRVGFKLATKDIFLNITGGITVNDPAIDLAVIMAILSSNENINIGSHFCFAGEVGLSGEIRSVPKIDQRVNEAEKLGFKNIFLSKYNNISTTPKKINIQQVSNIEEAVKFLYK
ncbi:DNA repair protein RadA [Elysia marginata]|uniref:DNA repair protein RadA n=1 Tax=Elysia marginata TaxID=1093978 RepID=A0AAV4H4F5_9GAST|nr:DNA repair protein RadA [Elysia marginata]